MRVEKERMLQMLRESIKDKGNQEKEKKIMERYKRVKFFGECISKSSFHTSSGQKGECILTLTVTGQFNNIYNVGLLKTN